MDDDELIRRLRSAAPHARPQRDIEEVTRRAAAQARRRRRRSAIASVVLAAVVLSLVIARVDREDSAEVAVGAARADSTVRRTTSQGVVLSYGQDENDPSLLKIGVDDLKFVGSSSEDPLPSAQDQLAVGPVGGPVVTGAVVVPDPSDPGGGGVAVMTVFLASTSLTRVSLGAGAVTDTAAVAHPGAVVLVVVLKGPSWAQATPTLTLSWDGDGGPQSFDVRPRLDLHRCETVGGPSISTTSTSFATPSTLAPSAPGAIPPPLDSTCS